MHKTIVIIGTLDSKGEEIKYLKELIEKRGHKTIVVDVGSLDEPLFPPDIHREHVSEAAETSFSEVRAFSQREANRVMTRGATEIVRGLYAQGDLDGIIGIGGTMGTSLGVTVMKALPLFLPKLMVSTVALSPLFRAEAVGKDLTMMPTVVELWEGISNEIIKSVLENAAGAIAGMVETHERKEISGKPLIGITAFGPPANMYTIWAKPLLQQRGYDVVLFPGFGTAFEETVEQGLIAGALDFMACCQLVNEICGGLNKAGPIRFEAGKNRGIPQVFAPAVAEFFSYPPPLDPLPPHLIGRKTGQRSIFMIGVKATAEEMAKAGEIMAQKLNEMTGPTAILLPTRGFSQWDKPDATVFPFYDPEGRRAFIETVKKYAKPSVNLLEIDLHIDDPQFAEEAVNILDQMMTKSFTT